MKNQRIAQLFGYAIFGFALTEAIALFASMMMMAFLLILTIGSLYEWKRVGSGVTTSERAKKGGKDKGKSRAMPTLNQLIRHGREEKRRTDRTRVSDQCPQKQGVRPRVPTRTPKKPNSAPRKIAKKVRLSNRHDIFAHIPGEGHNSQEHPMVLIRGGRVRVTRVIFRPPQPLPDPDDDYSTNPSDYEDSWDEMEVDDPSSSEEESEDSDDYSTNPSDYEDSWDEMEVDPSWSEEESEEEESSAESDGYSADDEFGF